MENPAKKDPLDHWIPVLLIVTLILLLGTFAGFPFYVLKLVIAAFDLKRTPLAELLFASADYLVAVGYWGIALIFIFAFRRYRPLRYIFGRRPKGNRFPVLLFCAALGCVMNGGCALLAGAMGYLDFSSCDIRWGALLFMIPAVLIQSAGEELLVRGIMLNLLMKRYNNRFFLGLVTSVYFAVLHLGNKGITIWAFLTLCLSGLLFYLIAYYLDSYWGAGLFHFAWNYTQAFLFGLPNSGIEATFSFIRTRASEDTNLFFFDPVFGIEGSGIAIIVEAVACLAIFLYGRYKKRSPLNVWEVNQ